MPGPASHAGRHVQGFHGYDEAHAFFPKQVGLRHAAVLEHQLARGGGADAHFVLLLAEGEAGHALFKDEGAGAAGAALGVGLGDDAVNIGFAAVGDPLLGPVEDVVVAVELGGGGDSAGVAAALASVRPKATSNSPPWRCGAGISFLFSLPG